jgi:hypothetical protein
LKKGDLQLDELLARGRLGGPAYDEILERVLDRTDGELRPRTTRVGWTRNRVKWVLLPGGVLATALAWLLLVRPAHDGFATKAIPGRATGALDVGCGPSGGRQCRAGDTLMFTVNAALTSGYVGAYAERVDDPSHARIWYFPSAAGSAPVVAPAAGTIVVPDGIKIGPEHRPGRYRVAVWISSQPLGRDQLDRVADEGVRSRSTFEIDVAP